MKEKMDFTTANSSPTGKNKPACLGKSGENSEVSSTRLGFFRGENEEDSIMRESILENKMILAVDHDPDVLAVLEEEIRAACPNCVFDKAATYTEASERIASFIYDLVILDIRGVRGFDLLRKAASYNLPVALLTAHPLTPEALGYYSNQVHAYLPKERLSEIVPFLEEALKHHSLPGWRYHFDDMTGFCGKKIQIDWRKSPPLTRQRWFESDITSTSHS
jgi:CheY-like chemotaxis protein